MARDGMSNLILQVRKHANAGTADYTVAGVTYFTDDQIQTYLDQQRVDYRTVPLQDAPIYSGGSLVYFDYHIPSYVPKFIEESAADSGFQVVDGSNNVVGTASYSVNYDAGIITFAADTGGSSSYYLDCRTYGLYKAVAAVYVDKAGFVANRVDWSSDNHSVKASQEAAHYREMARQFNAMSGAYAVKMIRSDEA